MWQNIGGINFTIGIARIEGLRMTQVFKLGAKSYCPTSSLQCYKAWTKTGFLKISERDLFTSHDLSPVFSPKHEILG